MARKPAPSDFTVPVDTIGTFVFGKRTMRDECAIQVEFARIVDGVEPTAWLQAVGGWLSTLRVLTVRAPEGWNLEELDPLDDSSYAKLALVHTALSDKERSFRQQPAAPSQGSGE
jgi:hypothetical protein